MMFSLIMPGGLDQSGCESGPKCAHNPPAPSVECNKPAGTTPVTFYVSYQQWFEIEYPDAGSIPLSVADVQPLHFANHIDACLFRLMPADDLTFYELDSPQVAEFNAYFDRWRA